MARAIQEENEAVNADSFLDIVASVVSVLIIMVMVTGLKIKNTPIDAPVTAEVAQARSELVHDLAGEATMRTDVMRAAAEVQTVQTDTLVKSRERDRLALVVDAIQHRIQGARQGVDQKSEQDSALTARLVNARNQLDEVQHQVAAVEAAPSTAVQIESYPTPLGQTVDGHEIHFQLRAGRIAEIPLEPLLAQFKSDAQHKVYKLQDLPEVTDVVGPAGGFRLRYTLERYELSDEYRGTRHAGGSYVRLKRWTLIPVADDLGETVAEALAEGSQFHGVLHDRTARDATVTIWTYPDSFDAFRKIKKELYRLGFPVAARPLPDGTPISGSPEGTKSTAE